MDIQFLGAAGEVTGSCSYIRCAGKHVLLDCGLFQGARHTETQNRASFPFDPRQIDAVILSHAHLDHSGRLPLLAKAGFRGHVYAQGASCDLCRIMLRDAAYLNERDAEWENRKRERKGLEPVAPLYTRRDAQRIMRFMRPLAYGDETEILPGIRVRLRDAGHILGSAIVELRLSEGDVERKLVFSGDLGHWDAPILRDPEPVTEADVVLMESTYGDRHHRSWEATWEELAEVLRTAAHHRGNILIPSFAVGRTQELLYLFRQNYQAWNLDRWRVFLDSPMGIEATEVYARHWYVYDAEAKRALQRGGNPLLLPNLTISRTASQSMAINRIRAGAIILAGSGMCEGGRIRHHLKHNAWRQGSSVVIVGYQARGTLGRSLVDGATRIRLWGEEIRVAAKVHTIGGLSAHADQKGLLDWAGNFRGRPLVVLVHGEARAREALAERLPEVGRDAVHLPVIGERMDLTRLDRRQRRH
ncbi:MAG: MBL fold metallo-hydrolase [Gammaproteobacteria bacterium]|nr:MBL fold metallo-hydrolase [Gammaproteobacteria bacterium]